MSDGRDDNIFDQDNALDFIIYEECEKGSRARKQGNGRGGCLGLVLLMLAPVGLVAVLFRAISSS